MKRPCRVEAIRMTSERRGAWILYQTEDGHQVCHVSRSVSERWLPIAFYEEQVNAEHMAEVMNTTAGGRRAAHLRRRIVDILYRDAEDETAIRHWLAWGGVRRAFAPDDVRRSDN